MRDCDQGRKRAMSRWHSTVIAKKNVWLVERDADLQADVTRSPICPNLRNNSELTSAKIAGTKTSCRWPEVRSWLRGIKIEQRTSLTAWTAPRIDTCPISSFDFGLNFHGSRLSSKSFKA